MTFSWPPNPLGLRAPLNLVWLRKSTRPALARTWWHAVILGLATPCLMLILDQILFAGVSLQRIFLLGSQPPATRFLIFLYSSITEELIHRVGVATLFAWLTFVLTRRFVMDPRNLSQWVGTVVAALLFGLSHVGNSPNAPYPILRAVTLNGVAGLALGWLYWSRGLESAVGAHLIADAVLYFVVPAFL